ncbi:SDR family NAD(P)-dependent oxidoreductase [Streptomyces sp. NPDC000151]|uniref:SDR family NAD(P)-dependent oxidoreductase n=1 Tax=Streptomyces sp. NPDC000151 TaxID=3154244 RepID=UPI0033265EEF
MRTGTTKDVRGRVCLVTGGAGGIGWEISKALANAGALVHICDSSLKNLRTAAAQAPKDACVFHQLDVAERHSLERWITDTYTAAGRVDVLVNNAAFVRWTDVTEMSATDTERTLYVGIHATAHAIRTVLPLMQAGGSGHIINMGSAAGTLLVPGPSAAYAASKAAIAAYTDILRAELHRADSPVHVTLVRPGAVAGTDFFRRHVPSSRMPRATDWLPATRPEQVAQAVLRAIEHHRPAVDIPPYLPLLYRLYALAPGLFRRFAAASGPSRRDYAHHPGDHSPAKKRA